MYLTTQAKRFTNLNWHQVLSVYIQIENSIAIVQVFSNINLLSF